MTSGEDSFLWLLLNRDSPQLWPKAVPRSKKGDKMGKRVAQTRREFIWVAVKLHLTM